MKYSAAQLLESITIAHKDGIVRPVVMDSHKYSQSNIRAYYDLLAAVSGKTHQIAPYNAMFLFSCLEMVYAEKDTIPDLLKDDTWILVFGEDKDDLPLSRKIAKQWMDSSEYNIERIRNEGPKKFLNRILRDTLQVVYNKCE